MTRHVRKAVSTSNLQRSSSQRSMEPSDPSTMNQPTEAPSVSSLRNMRDVLDTIGRQVSMPNPPTESQIPQHQSSKRVSFASLTPFQKEALRESILSLPSVPTHAPKSVAEGQTKKIKDAAYYTKPFCTFLTENPTVFHAVDALGKELKDGGYTKLSERDAWQLKKGGKYYVERNGSSLIAFSIGDGYEPGNGAAILAGHVDALTAKLKPIPKLRNKAGYVQLGVAPYAGALNSTWWDRDLGVGGRVLIKESSGKITSKLVKLDWPSEYKNIKPATPLLILYSRSYPYSCATFWSGSERTVQSGDKHDPHNRTRQHRSRQYGFFLLRAFISDFLPWWSSFIHCDTARTARQGHCWSTQHQ
jgi:hypothetical protein